MIIIDNYYVFYHVGFLGGHDSKEMCMRVCVRVPERSLSHSICRRVSRSNYGITHELE